MAEQFVQYHPDVVRWKLVFTEDFDFCGVDEGRDFGAAAFSTHSISNYDIFETTFLTDVIILDDSINTCAVTVMMLHLRSEDLCRKI